MTPPDRINVGVQINVGVLAITSRAGSSGLAPRVMAPLALKA